MKLLGWRTSMLVYFAWLIRKIISNTYRGIIILLTTIDFWSNVNPDFGIRVLMDSIQHRSCLIKLIGQIFPIPVTRRRYDWKS